MVQRVLIANRGEIAVRIARAAASAGIGTVSIFSADDAKSPHRFKADDAVILAGHGPAAYLNVEGIVSAALEKRCDAIHPGYGFLSENAEFARACARAGINFVGPSPEVLQLFGNKVTARDFAVAHNIPVATGSSAEDGVDGAAALLRELGGGRSIMLKASDGGGGRGIRVVSRIEELVDAWAQCVAEARSAFGSEAVFAEEHIGRARHIEVQVLGDGASAAHLFERECSLQRRHQKVIEIAPSPWLEDGIRQKLFEHSVALTLASGYRGLGTVEFLVECGHDGQATGRYIFLEVNPRLQVEHTVTEMVTGHDLVALQFAIASGETLGRLGLDPSAGARPTGYAVQLRVNTETLSPDGAIKPSVGTLTAYDPPSGPGIRVDGYATVGYATSPLYDALLAKLIVHSPSADFANTALRARRAVREFRIEGVDTNLAMMHAVLHDEAVINGRIDTGFIERHAQAIAKAANDGWQPLYDQSRPEQAASVEEMQIERGQAAVYAPSAGQLVGIDVEVGDLVTEGQRVAMIEVMKMQNTVTAPASGRIESILRQVGDSLAEKALLMAIHPQDVEAVSSSVDEFAADWSDAGLRTLQEYRQALQDEARPATVETAKRRGVLTARQRIRTFCDPDSFTEIGGLVRVVGLDQAPGDGVVLGTARIDGRAIVLLSQDFSVFGGSVGHVGSLKIDRAFEIALRNGMPLVLMLDGGGHRIQDGQNSREYARAGDMFAQLTRLSGFVPIVAIALGAGFAANTNMAGFSDFAVMVRDTATLGIAGPALVRAGTGEIIDAQSLGGAHMQVDVHGLADLAVDTEDEAMTAARRFLSYLPSNARARVPLFPRDASDDAPERAELLLRAVPTNTRRSYDVRPVIAHLADANSVFEIKPTYARNLVTSFGRIGGRPVGFIANQALVLSGMLDAAACEKGAHFIAVCDAFGLPLVYLADVPGVSIGSGAEKTNLGRRSARFIFELGCATVPRVSVTLRKGYGFGYLAMAGGSSFAADGRFAWPDAEICAMSIEGSVDVAYRKLYETAPDPLAKRQELIDEIRSRISPIQAAEGFGIDDLIDPRETRARIIEVLDRAPPRRDLHMPSKYRAIAPI